MRHDPASGVIVIMPGRLQRANRANVGRLLSFAASAVSAVLVFSLLTAVDLAQRLGLNVNVRPGTKRF